MKNKRDMKSGASIFLGQGLAVGGYGSDTEGSSDTPTSPEIRAQRTMHFLIREDSSPLFQNGSRGTNRLSERKGREGKGRGWMITQQF